ncbi:MAG: hypothetical protein OHK0021_05400 [Bryobacter sp.]
MLRFAFILAVWPAVGQESSISPQEIIDRLTGRIATPHNFARQLGLFGCGQVLEEKRAGALLLQHGSAAAALLETEIDQALLQAAPNSFQLEPLLPLYAMLRSHAAIPRLTSLLERGVFDITSKPIRSAMAVANGLTGYAFGPPPHNPLITCDPRDELVASINAILTGLLRQVQVQPRSAVEQDQSTPILGYLAHFSPAEFADAPAPQSRFLLPVQLHRYPRGLCGTHTLELTPIHTQRQPFAQGFALAQENQGALLEKLKDWISGRRPLP